MKKYSLVWVCLLWFGCAANGDITHKKRKSLSVLHVREEGMTLSGDWVRCLEHPATSDEVNLDQRLDEMAWRQAQKIGLYLRPVRLQSHGFLYEYLCSRYTFRQVDPE